MRFYPPGIGICYVARAHIYNQMDFDNLIAKFYEITCAARRTVRLEEKSGAPSDFQQLLKIAAGDRGARLARRHAGKPLPVKQVLGQDHAIAVNRIGTLSQHTVELFNKPLNGTRACDVCRAARTRI